jgi:5'-3' exonuclease
MGIPSYFKRLTDSIPGLVRPAAQEKIGYLLFDFNCIVYGCLRSSAMPAYVAEEHDTWEAKLCDEVCEELVRLWTTAGKPAHVFVAVDGVVPMAKIKQQRMRRFKSVWLAEQECAHGVRGRDEARWDTNSITPGTQFMSRLGSRLQKLCIARKWIVSTSDEPGEGEHKVMQWLRSAAAKGMEEGAVAVYGLDADLILLAALTQTFTLSEKNPCYLFREAAEFGGGRQGPSYLFLSIQKLIDTLTLGIPDKRQFFLDYCVGMSLLGNDFLPHGLQLRIRDGGHDTMLELLKGFLEEGKYLVDAKTLKVNWPVFHEFATLLGTLEEQDILGAILKKRKTRPMNPRNDTERLMEPVQKLPLEWFVEEEFLTSDRKNLHEDWKTVYSHHVPEEACAEYKYGIQWVLDYYMGSSVNFNWYYPWHLPPLLSSLLTCRGDIRKNQNSEQAPIQPEEQLAMVLPMESWHLIQNRKLRQIPSLLPQFWPTRFEFVSHGRLWMWECEADIPILTPGRLRSVVFA